MTREELENAPFAPPVTKSIKVGRVLMLVGTALMFMYAFVSIAVFGISLYVPTVVGRDLSDPLSVLSLSMLIPSAIFLVFVGIGGMSYVAEKGPFLKWASIGAIVLGIYIVVDLVLDIRTIAHNINDPQIKASTAWTTFFLGFAGLQINGGIYFVGWFLAKNYLD